MRRTRTGHQNLFQHVGLSRYDTVSDLGVDMRRREFIGILGGGRRCRYAVLARADEVIE